MAARKQLSATLKDISAEARERRWKYGRRSGDEGDREVAESESYACSDGSWDAGKGKGDAQVGE